jgi:hypothetical protein
LRLNEAVDPLKLRRMADEEGIMYGAGAGFFADLMGDYRGGPPGVAPIASSPYVRLAFSYTAAELIPEGIRRLARAMRRAAE